ncbi:MAG: DsbC family protein [Polaromonas sp.]|uniref:DsbC family protein n=1 Tax=Polaromonas sp. TaxID=1869339 RepID=UPI0032676F55
MKFLKSIAVLGLMAFSLVPAFAQEAVIRKNLAEKFPAFAKIDEVTKTPMSGLYEVRLGFDIFYTDEQGNYLLQGHLLDVKTRKNLTEERIGKLSAVDFEKLPLGDAVKIVRGDGKRKLAVFEDPNCGYCKRFERDLTSIDNITVYLFLYPVLGPDSISKSRDIWCAKDRAKSWNDWMLRNATPVTAECNIAAIKRNRDFGQKYNITGTPTLIFANGSRTPGAVSAQEVEKMLVSAKAP